MYKKIFLAILILTFSGFLITSNTGCVVVAGNTLGNESVSFDNYVDLFSQAYYDNDSKLGLKLKKGFPSFYKRMMKNLEKSAKDKEKSQEDRDSALEFFKWAKTIK